MRANIWPSNSLDLNLFDHFLWGVLQARTQCFITLKRQEFEDVHRTCDMQNQKGGDCGSGKTVSFSCGGSYGPRGRPY